METCPDTVSRAGFIGRRSRGRSSRETGVFWEVGSASLQGGCGQGRIRTRSLRYQGHAHLLIAPPSRSTTGPDRLPRARYCSFLCTNTRVSLISCCRGPPSARAFRSHSMREGVEGGTGRQDGKPEREAKKEPQGDRPGDGGERTRGTKGKEENHRHTRRRSSSVEHSRARPRMQGLARVVLRFVQVPVTSHAISRRPYARQIVTTPAYQPATQLNRSPRDALG